jgi:hypothetical protein
MILMILKMCMKRRRIYSRGTPKKRNRRSGIADKNLLQPNSRR